MPKVKFTNDAIYETEGRGKGQHFKAGKIYEMTEDKAQRWIRRNAAELVDEKPEPEKAPEPVNLVLSSLSVNQPDSPNEDDDEGEGDDTPARRRPGRPRKV